MKKLGIVILMVAAIIVTSCSSHREPLNPRDLANASVEQRFDAMVDTYKPWNKISVPVKVELKSPANVSLSGRAYMVCDSLVHVSLRLLGFEIALLHVTPDSAYCVDKFHQIYMCEDIKKFSASTGITLADVQSVLLGRAFVPGSKSKLARSSKQVELALKNTDGDNGWLINIVPNKTNKFECVFDVDATDNQVSSMTVNVPGHKPANCLYTKRSSSEIGSVPSVVTAKMSVQSKELEAALKYTVSSLQVDNVSIPSFRRPGSNYSKISSSQLLKTLSSM